MSFCEEGHFFSKIKHNNGNNLEVKQVQHKGKIHCKAYLTCSTEIYSISLRA